MRPDLAERARRESDDWPPLTASQRERIAALLGGRAVTGR